MFDGRGCPVVIVERCDVVEELEDAVAVALSCATAFLSSKTLFSNFSGVFAFTSISWLAFRSKVGSGVNILGGDLDASDTIFSRKHEKCNKKKKKGGEVEILSKMYSVEWSVSISTLLFPYAQSLLRQACQWQCRNASAACSRSLEL